MKGKISLSLFTILLLFSCNNGQDEPSINLPGTRYQDEVFSYFNVIKSVFYSENYTAGGNLQKLTLDFFEPRGDTLQRRPLIIIMVGEAFVSVSHPLFDPLAEIFTSLGYTVANINYRVDDRPRGFFEPIDSLSTMDNLIKARSDLKGAIRFFRRNAAEGNEFRIDPENIFVIGYSAGSLAALSATYLDANDDVSPQLAQIIANNGGWEGNSGHQEFSSEIKGLINISGAVIDTAIIDPGEIPSLSIHGQSDSFVPFCKGLLKAPLIFKLQPFNVQGSCLIYLRSQEVGLESYLLPIEEGDHDAAFKEELCPDCFAAMVQFLGSLL